MTILEKSVLVVAAAFGIFCAFMAISLYREVTANVNVGKGAL